MATITEPMTHAEFRAIPEDPALRRELINGELIEEPSVVNAYSHGEVVAAISYLLLDWSRSNADFRGRVSSGDVACELRDRADTTVGIDVLVAQPGQRRTEAGFLQGPPLLAVEVVSANDAAKKLVERQELFLRAGIPLSWLVDPFQRTVAVRRPGRPLAVHTETEELCGDPELPGFRTPVSAFFPAPAGEQAG